jgi:putative glycerol-1-phosphate prenyltransferase
MHKPFFESKKKQVAFLVDPDKFDFSNDFIENVLKYPPDYIFVGGSSMISKEQIEAVILFLKQKINIPIVIFPGHPMQRSSKADAILILSVLQSNQELYITGHLKTVAEELLSYNIPLIPTVYLIISDNKKSSTIQFTGIDPIASKDFDAVKTIVLTSQVLNYQAIYLEAGSGAEDAIQFDLIKQIRTQTKQFLIVGGGIKNRNQMIEAFQLGADCVVIGTAIEKDVEMMKEFYINNS